MMESNQFQFSLLTWAYLLLILLLIPWVHHGADAQSPIQPAPSFAAHHYWDPSIAVMVGALLCAFLFMGFFSIYLRHCAESYITVQNPIGSAADWSCSCSEGISKEVLDTFPILVYSTIKNLKIGKEALECAICLNEFRDSETLRLLPKCSHVFHPDCIDAWLASHVTCPVCRAKLNSDSVHLAITIPTQLPANELNEENPETGEIEQQQVVPNLNEGQRNSNSISEAVDAINVEEAAGKQNCSGKSRMFGKLPRSNSTGHSLVEPGKNLEKYTLRLPEDVRKYILLNHGAIQRSASYNVIMPMVGNSKKGMCWSDSEGSSRGRRDDVEPQERRMFSRSPPFVCRG